MRPLPFLLAGCLVVGCGETQAPAQAPPPAAERPLLDVPDPSAPTQRGVYLKDPKGQVERIAAGGSLVAWSVRTPADKPGGGAEGELEERTPERLPESSKVVIADERGGAPLRVGLGKRWVARLRMIRGGPVSRRSPCGPAPRAPPSAAGTSC